MKGICLRFNAGVEYKGKIYASTIGINGLFELDLETKTIEYIKRFSKEKACFAIHRCAFLYGKEAWFIPQNGKYISVVNLDTMEIEYLKPPYRRINEDSVSRINAVYYSGNIIKGRFLYLIPANIDAMLLIDLETKKMYPYYDVSKQEDYHAYGEYENGCIYLFPFNGNRILEVELRTNRRRKLPWRYPVDKYGEIVKCNNKFWFAPLNADHILVLDLQTGEKEKIHLNEYYSVDCLYEQIICLGSTMLLVPFQADKILMLDVKSKQLSATYLSDDLLNQGKNGFTKIYSENNIILASYSKNVVLIYDRKKEDFRILKLGIELEGLVNAVRQEKNDENWDLEKFFWKDFDFSNMFYDEEHLSVDNYIRFIPIKQDRNKDLANVIRTIGMDIWDIVGSDIRGD